MIAVYNYAAADEDELCFNKGDHILVIKHPQPEEQVDNNNLKSQNQANIKDDGWLLGIRKKVWEEKSDLKASWGLFPENFTRPTD